LPPSNSASHNLNISDATQELLRATNDKLDTALGEVKALRSELKEAKSSSEAIYSQLQRVQTAMDRSIAESSVRNAHLEDMGATVTDMCKVLGMFTIGIKGIEGMKSTIVQQYSSSEKSSATRNSYKTICGGVIKAFYQEYAKQLATLHEKRFSRRVCTMK